MSRARLLGDRARRQASASGKGHAAGDAAAEKVAWEALDRTKQELQDSQAEARRLAEAKGKSDKALVYAEQVLAQKAQELVVSQLRVQHLESELGAAVETERTCPHTGHRV